MRQTVSNALIFAQFRHNYCSPVRLHCLRSSLVTGQAVANKLHGTEVDVTVIKTKDDGCDHVQFMIMQKARPGDAPDALPVASDWHTIESSMTTVDNKISPLTFCKAFPFHLVFDKNLVVRQVYDNR